MKKLAILAVLAMATIFFTGCGGGSSSGGGGGYVPPPEPAMDVLYLDDINGDGMANVPYSCDSGSGMTDMDGAFYFYWGEACELDLFGFNGNMSFSLHIDDADAMGIEGIPFECTSGWNGTTDSDGSFDYDSDDYCTFYL